VDPRSSLDAVEKRKIHAPLPGIEPRPSMPSSVIILSLADKNYRNDALEKSIMGFVRIRLYLLQSQVIRDKYIFNESRFHEQNKVHRKCIQEVNPV
jgi:hypothetical protein